LHLRFQRTHKRAIWIRTRRETLLLGLRLLIRRRGLAMCNSERQE
jgi:hypothetical protein